MKKLITLILLFCFAYIISAASVSFEINGDSVAVYSLDSLLIKGELISLKENQVIGKFPGLGIVKYKKKNYTNFQFKDYKKWYREDYGQTYTFMGNHTAFIIPTCPIQIRSALSSLISFDYTINSRIQIFSHLGRGGDVFLENTSSMNLGIKALLFNKSGIYTSVYCSAFLPIMNYHEKYSLSIGVPISFSLRNILKLHGALRYEYTYYDDIEYGYRYIYDSHQLSYILSGELFISSRIKWLLEHNGNILNTIIYRDTNHHYGDSFATGFRFIFKRCIINIGGGFSKRCFVNDYRWSPFPYSDISFFLGNGKGD